MPSLLKQTRAATLPEVPVIVALKTTDADLAVVRNPGSQPAPSGLIRAVREHATDGLRAGVCERLEDEVLRLRGRARILLREHEAQRLTSSGPSDTPGDTAGERVPVCRRVRCSRGTAIATTNPTMMQHPRRAQDVRRIVPPLQCGPFMARRGDDKGQRGRARWRRQAVGLPASACVVDAKLAGVPSGLVPAGELDRVAPRLTA